MDMHHGRTRKGIAGLAAWSLLIAPSVRLLGGPGSISQATAAPQPTASVGRASAAPSTDGGWPKAYETPTGARLIVYQPQVASWEEEKRIILYAAVSYTPRDATTPALGTIQVKAKTKVSKSERLVDFSDFEIADSNFPTLSKDQVQEIVAELNSAIPQNGHVIALDRVLANIDTSQIVPKNAAGLKADPPTVFFSQRPAVLVNIDDDPIWGAIANNDLQYAINTNWDLFKLEPTGQLYLRDGDAWLKASALAGPWTPAGTLPVSFTKLPANDNWKAVKASLPGRALAPANVPVVFVSTTPAELILLNGPPAYQNVPGTGLLWVSNTESDVFRLGSTGPVYYLVAGRWFSAPGFTGPWTFATPRLPADFSKIPLDHPRSRVLASVPGTPQAAEAVLLADVPQTARVQKTLQAPEVAYQGPPHFQPIENTTVARAVNTDKDIIKVGDLYYMCFQGVWFMSQNPTGPWHVADSVPAEIYEIPASSPAYNVTSVTVEDSGSDWVDFAAAAAYTGVMVGWGCAVWGTGYYYPPYIWARGPYPAYFSHYPTYGYSAWYNPWTGSYGRGAAAYGPYGGAGVAARYNPTTGRYSRGAAAWGPYGGAAAVRSYNARTGTYARGGVAAGPYGARGAAEAYNPRTGAYGATRQGSGVYGSWGSTAVQRGDQWATTSRVTNRATGTTGRVTETSQGSAVSRRGPQGNAFAGKSSSGNLYAGRDGNVYRSQGGGWQKYDNGGWNSVQRPQSTQNFNRAGQGRFDSSTAGQLNRDSFARAEGAQRTSDWGKVRTSGAGAGSFRPSGGGGFRGGGGSRGGGRR
jgi:hypothetical protein